MIALVLALALLAGGLWYFGVFDDVTAQFAKTVKSVNPHHFTQSECGDWLLENGTAHRQYNKEEWYNFGVVRNMVQDGDACAQMNYEMEVSANAARCDGKMDKYGVCSVPTTAIYENQLNIYNGLVFPPRSEPIDRGECVAVNGACPLSCKTCRVTSP